MAKIWMQGKERFMCPVCKNEELELGQKYCQICGEPLEWEEDKQDHFVEANKTIGKDINAPTKWIPVEERLPEPGEPVWATVKHSEWISDYDTDWLPEAEKTYHPESYGVYKAEYIGEGIWQYYDDYCEWIYCDAVEKEERNLANVYDTVTAWMPLPEPYRKEE